MIDSVAKNVVDLLAKRLTGQAIGASLGFWLVAATLYLLTRPAAATQCAPGYTTLWCGIKVHGGVGTGVLVALALAVIVGTTSLISAGTPAITGLLLGDQWPGRRPWRALAAKLARRHAERRAKLWAERDKAEQLSDPIQSTTAQALVWQRIDRYPREQAIGDLIGPTVPGNVLRAVVQRVRSWSGLDLAVCWPLLITVVPEHVRTELTTAATTVVMRAQLLCYSVLTISWWFLIGWNWSLIPLAVVTILAVVAAMHGFRSATVQYAQGIESCVRLHRMNLYDALALPRPKNNTVEPDHGRILTDYLRREAAAGLLEFTHTHPSHP